MKLGRRRVFGVEDSSLRARATGAMVEQVRRASGSGACDEHGASRTAEDRAEVGDIEEARLLLLDPEQVVAVGSVETGLWVHAREEHGVAKESVPLGVRASRDGRGVHPRHRRENRVVLREPHAVVGQSGEARHEPGDHIVGRRPSRTTSSWSVGGSAARVSTGANAIVTATAAAASRPTPRTIAVLRLRRGLIGSLTVPGLALGVAVHLPTGGQISRHLVDPLIVILVSSSPASPAVGNPSPLGNFSVGPSYCRHVPTAAGGC